MSFGNLKTDAGLTKLNAFLQDKSYISGYQLSQTDEKVFQELGKAPNIKYVHVLRWYNHIKSHVDAGRKADSDAACPLETCPVTKPKTPAPADDDDVDLFASDDEDDAEAAKIREERVKAYAEKKSKKPALIAKSSIVFDVKPWDDETDMKELEKSVRTVVMEGLVWGAGKLVPVGYGINKLQIMCVVEDEKVSVDLLQEEIQNFEDYVQSVDIAAFNKI